MSQEGRLRSRFRATREGYDPSTPSVPTEVVGSVETFNTVGVMSDRFFVSARGGRGSPQGPVVHGRGRQTTVGVD